jgi:NitT/TauT family transport system permease protein
MKNFITRNRIISVAAVLLLFIIWKLVSLWMNSGQLVPSPEKTLVSVAEVITRENFLRSLLTTVLRGFAGFLISFALAFLLGIPAGLNNTFRLFLSPVLVTFRSTPVVSLILLAIIWLGNEMVPVFIAVLTMFPIICTNIIDGVHNVDRDLVEMARIYRVRKNRVILEIYIPSITPFLTSGVSSALGFGWRAIIIGEVLSQPSFGVGTQMANAQIFLQVSELIAWTLIAIIVSAFFEFLVRLAERKIVSWK